MLQALQQLAKKAWGGFGVASALHQDVEPVPVLIDRAPEIVQFAAHAEEPLIEEPFAAWPGRRRVSVVANRRPQRRLQSRTVSEPTPTPRAARISSTHAG